jgi:Terpene cyclase DEP1
MKIFLIGCCIAGTVIPYAFAMPFFLAHGLNLRLLLQEAFANPSARFFAADLLLSSVMFLSWSRRESRSRQMEGWWMVLLANLVVGLSLALPLYLLKRSITLASVSD